MHPEMRPGHDEVDLLQLVVSFADMTWDASVRRQRLLEKLGELLSASAGLWAWGKGRPDTDWPTTIASLQFGLNRSQLALFQQFSLSDKSRQEFQRPLMTHFNQHDGILCAVRSDLVDEAHWNAANWIYNTVHSIGMNSWLHSVRYDCKDTWSSVVLFRDIGVSEFGDREKSVMRRALAGIQWLWAPRVTAETVTPSGHLTGRQRTVMWMLLSGLPRKQIAQQLSITEDTVGNHVKAIFSYFQVESSMELAALFLRSQ
tara:strand:- start:4605 stop:5378 length:774 start_codon:yes stop_codon:yes gene_type:complete